MCPFEPFSAKGIVEGEDLGKLNLALVFYIEHIFPSKARWKKFLNVDLCTVNIAFERDIHIQKCSPRKVFKSATKVMTVGRRSKSSSIYYIML
ncbi:uncharacterized protein PHALS_14324 [Plasmopara halstedii]|uniref:Uncharacterized protein n=1 Tax=Plasmopara halstedii TaxID=4781 RepID=A0A0P1ASI0_PLAHL|nr:uncharacterized protein PHALS_14324 [Plasmopara halstedii]CEG44054.1 hypothetical protein PHALS_14324 [Plasmopara halstedii]|eukprot:XP_024580423.1 hypothetical protein PHALS_14324 [Plasmopara halstedii]